jgi:hypothetical protein
MERRTLLTINVIRAAKAFWIAQPGQIEEHHAEQELARALDAYLGGDNESGNAQEAGAKHPVSRGDG